MIIDADQLETMSWDEIQEIRETSEDTFEDVFILPAYIEAWMAKVDAIEADEFSRLGFLPKEGWLFEEAHECSDGSLLLLAIHPHKALLEDAITSKLEMDLERAEDEGCTPREIALVQEMLEQHRRAIREGAATDILMVMLVPPEHWIWGGNQLTASMFDMETVH